MQGREEDGGDGLMGGGATHGGRGRGVVLPLGNWRMGGGGGGGGITHRVWGDGRCYRQGKGEGV